jgi:hypothetical protein
MLFRLIKAFDVVNFVPAKKLKQSVPFLLLQLQSLCLYLFVDSRSDIFPAFFTVPAGINYMLFDRLNSVLFAKLQKRSLTLPTNCNLNNNSVFVDISYTPWFRKILLRFSLLTCILKCFQLDRST